MPEYLEGAQVTDRHFCYGMFTPITLGRLGKPPVDIPVVTFQLYLYGVLDPILGGREARDHDNEKKSYLILVIRCMTTQTCVSLGISNLVLGIILRWDGIPKIAVHRKLTVSKDNGKEENMFILVWCIELCLPLKKTVSLKYRVSWNKE